MPKKIGYKRSPMKKGSTVHPLRNSDYPATTKGSQIAARVRAESNKLSEAQREALFQKGMQLIYGGNGTKEKVGRR